MSASGLLALLALILSVIAVVMDGFGILTVAVLFLAVSVALGTYVKLK